ncbi:hypothetical protein G4B88_007053 [Cannabis sativa]|uniref:Terpene synthase n=1 Tax=Cannabis sativa TaxID=3483 RepID=A0A7J6FR16_CANSA|nr:hypothetical protein G4B88_007053 [Cannabis sativa]
MKQYGVSEEETCDEMNRRVVIAWKEINEEFLKPTEAASPILVRALNLARVIDLLYKNGDNYTQVGKVTKDNKSFTAKPFTTKFQLPRQVYL